VKYVAHILSDDVAEKLRALMRRLGLVYGAIDLRMRMGAMSSWAG